MVTSCPRGFHIIFVVTPLTSGKTETAWTDKHAKPMTAFFKHHLLVRNEDIIFLVYLDAASFGVIRRFGVSLCPAGPTPQSGLVKIIILVSEFLIASQRQWCLSNDYFDVSGETFISALFYLNISDAFHFKAGSTPQDVYHISNGLCYDSLT